MPGAYCGCDRMWHVRVWSSERATSGELDLRGVVYEPDSGGGPDDDSGQQVGHCCCETSWGEKSEMRRPIIAFVLIFNLLVAGLVLPTPGAVGAAATTVFVTPDNTQGWATTADTTPAPSATVNIVADSTAPGGGGGCAATHHRRDEYSHRAVFP